MHLPFSAIFVGIITLFRKNMFVTIINDTLIMSDLKYTYRFIHTKIPQKRRTLTTLIITSEQSH